MITWIVTFLSKACRSIFPVLWFLVCAVQVSATTYYSRSSGANWNAAISWSTVTYAGPAGSGFPVAGDTVNIANGITVFVNTTSACSVINIGQGTSGGLQFGSGGNFTLTVSGNITVNNGATLFYNSNFTRTHSLKIGGGLVNNGTVDMVYDANDLVNITFDGASNSIISGTGTWALNNVTMNKSAVSITLDVQSPGFETAMVNFIPAKGTYVHNNIGSYVVNGVSSSDYTIGSNVIFKIPQGTCSFSSGANRLYLQGGLYVNGGNVFVGTTAGLNGIRYDQSGVTVPYLEVSSGTLTVYGGISYASGAGTDAFSFKMTGGTVLVNTGSSGTIVEPFLINDVSSSSFVMSNGTIILQTPNLAGTSMVDFGICGNNGTVTTTGGTIQFGNSFTANGKVFSFKPFANAVQPNFFVTGTVGNAVTLATFNGTTSDFKLLSLRIGSGKTMDIRSYGGSNGDGKNMTITSTYNGVNAFNNDGTFNARSGTVTFSGSAAQTIGGSTSTTFYNLTMNASGDAFLAKPENVSNFLTMTLGRLITTSTNILTCTNTAGANIGSVNSYVDGPMIHTIASVSPITKTFPIGKGSSYRPAVLTLSHLTATSVTYRGEVINSSATALGYNLPSTLEHVSSVRYWDFTRQNVSNFNNGIVQLFYNVDDSVTDRAKIRVAHDDGSFNWIDFGGTGTANVTGSISSGSFASFKTKFAIGFIPTSLPIELVSFRARKSRDQVGCEWITSSEINNDYFTVERSADGMKFDSLLYVDGAGNSSNTNHYRGVDEKPFMRDSYYRLKQTNFDGTSSYSEAVHVYMEPPASAYKIFPNPSSGDFIFINKNGEDLHNAVVVVQDLSGKEIKSRTELSKNKTELQLSIEPSSCAKNTMYIVSVVSGNDSVKEKVLVSRK